MGLARIDRDAGFGGRLQLLGEDVPVLDGGFVQRGDRRHVSNACPIRNLRGSGATAWTSNGFSAD